MYYNYERIALIRSFLSIEVMAGMFIRKICQMVHNRPEMDESALRMSGIHVDAIIDCLVNNLIYVNATEVNVRTIIQNKFYVDFA